ncbi:hypothetical protein, partial [Klebsiella aerogenes]|uniref:hypothetical protein n=1 Tax=Klebsiella aerogenes TaxID=548 RepID=UPI001D0CE524
RKVFGEFNVNQLDIIFFDEICTCQLQKITKHFYDIDSLAPIDSSVGAKTVQNRQSHHSADLWNAWKARRLPFFVRNIDFV